MEVERARTPFVGISVGDKFNSFDELKEAIRAVEESTFVELCLRDSRTCVGIEKRLPLIAAKCNRDLKYYSLHYACIFGGKRETKRNKGVRRNTNTLKQDCKAAIRIGLTDDYQQLEVKACEDHHNHEISETIYNHLPRQRRLDSAHVEEAQRLLKLGSNKKKMQKHLQSSTGKVITLKDISNIRTSMNKNSSGNNILDVVEKLCEKEGSATEVFSEDGIMTGVLYQDSTMRAVYQRFPEIVLLDATYKLTELRMALYLLMVIDGNGQSQIVGVYLTCTEDHHSLSKMFQQFKKTNDAWPETKVVMTDKDMTERSVIKQELPNAFLQLCLFHVLRSFRREFTSEKMGIRPGIRDHLLELLGKMAHAKSEDAFSTAHEAFKSVGVIAATEYFDNNWLPIKEEWVRYLKDGHFTLSEQTNNRLESMNGKIKSVCSKYAKLDVFFSEFSIVLSSLRHEREHVSLMGMLKVPSNSMTFTGDENSYFNITTPYAFKLIQNQLQLSRKVKVPTDGSTFTTSEGPLSVTTHVCECSFWTTCKLPCRHIFAFRKYHIIDLFDASLVAERWTKQYFKDSETLKMTHSFRQHVGQSILQKPSTTTVRLSSHQKFRKVMNLAQELATLASEDGMEAFNSKWNTLLHLRNTWRATTNKMVSATKETEPFASEESVAKPQSVDGLCCISCDRQTKYHCITCSVTICSVCSVAELDEETPGWIAGAHVGYCNGCRPGVTSEAESTGRCPGVSRLEQHSEELDISRTESTTDGNTLLPRLETIDMTDLLREDGNSNSQPSHSTGLSAKRREELSQLKLPSKVKKRGRPKGAELTVIGLPKKKKRDGPVRFMLRQPQEKERVILSWFASPSNVDQAIQGKMRIQKDMIKTSHRTAACVDKNVCLDAIRKFTTKEAWADIMSIRDFLSKEGEDAFFCDTCTNPLYHESIMCDGCLQWSDLKCTRMKVLPKSRFWYCNLCKG